MTKYAKEVTDIITQLLTTGEERAFINVLKNDEISILRAEIIPAMLGPQRRALKALLDEQERLLKQAPARPSLSITQQLQNIYERYTLDMLNRLKTDAHEAFLKTATKEQLILLHQKLKYQPENKLFQAIEIELQNKAISEVELSANALNLEEEYKTWQALNKQIAQANQSITPKVVPKEKEPEKVVEVKPEGWFTKILRALGFIKSPVKPVIPIGNVKSAPPLTDDERNRLGELEKRGQANLDAVTKEAGPQVRSQKDVDTAIQSRFGMVLAAQMVAGTKTAHHKKPMQRVIDSIAYETDNAETFAKIGQALGNESPLTEEHMLKKGGQPLFVTVLERDIFSDLIGPNTHGIELTDEDRKKLSLYHANIERSMQLTAMTQPLQNASGAYSKVETGERAVIGKGVYEKLNTPERQEAQTKLEQDLAATSKFFQEKCQALQDGEAVYFDTGLEGHAMQLVIKREGDRFKLTTYDSSGALERSKETEGFNLWGAIKTAVMGQERKKKNAYSFTIPCERLLTPEGQNYLSYLIKTKTKAGWAEVSIDHNTNYKPRWYVSLLAKFFDFFKHTVAPVDARADKYLRYMKAFTSIATPDSPPHFEDMLQRPQNTMNCFAKKAQACELYELGRPTYKKVREALFKEQKARLIAEACLKIPIPDSDETIEYLPSYYQQMVKDIVPQYLSPAELHAASARLAEISSPPSPQAYKNFFNELHKTLSQPLDAETKALLTPRINDKLKRHLEEFIAHSATHGGTKLIESYFTSDPNEPNAKPPFVHFPEQGMLRFKWDDPLALQALSDFAAYQAWKATVQILNHQIEKVRVNERCINSESERLDKVSFKEAAKRVSIEDLANARIVNFTVGSFRKDETKIEINIGGKNQELYREIDKATFFKLVVANKEALTNPRVMSLLDYVRNISREMEQRYQKEVYNPQRQAFIEKITTRIQDLVESRKKLGAQFYEQKDELTILLKPFAEKKANLQQAILAAQAKAEGKETLLVKNLKLQAEILETEEQHIKTYLSELERKYRALDHEVKNSITQCTRSLEQLRSATDKQLTINEVSSTFIQTDKQLLEQQDKIAKHLVDAEVSFIDDAVNERLKVIHKHRAKVVKNNLQTNPEYRILEELAAGKFGSDKHRNREMYSRPIQSEVERVKHYREGKNSFPHGSVFQEIQILNQRVSAQMQEIANRQLILAVSIPDKVAMESLENHTEIFTDIDREAEKLKTQELPTELKAEWVKQMFSIWLKHQTPEDLYKLQEKHKDNLSFGINQAFHHFIEQKANIKYATLKTANYLIDIKPEQLPALGWKEIKESDVTTYLTKRYPSLSPQAKFRRAVLTFASLQKAEQARTQSAVEPPITLQAGDLKPRHNARLAATVYTPPDAEFSPREARLKFGGSTPEFLRANPKPSFVGLASALSKVECEQYYVKVQQHLTKLETNPNLENRAERIQEYCLSLANQILGLPTPPPAKLVNTLSEILIKPYRQLDPDKKELSLAQGFKQLENNERQQLLTALIKLQLSQLKLGKVKNEFYSAIKQWERFIIPQDKALSEKIATLAVGGTEPVNMTIVNEINIAISESPISLEAIHEGQLGLQKAIASYGGKEGEDQTLRELADRLYMRNGDVQLAEQFITYYQKRDNLLSTASGLNSTEGREFFSRATLDALQHASDPADKDKLLKFLVSLKTLNPKKEEAAKLTSSYQVFIDELLLKCFILDPKASQKALGVAKYAPTAVETYISNALKDDSSEKGTERLFVFAKEINLLTLKIEQEKLAKPINQVALDTLYSKLICSNLAYQLLMEQITEEAYDSIKHNFEYIKEMALVQTNLSKLEDSLIGFTENIGPRPFTQVWNDYVSGKKFDGSRLQGVTISKSDIPGFISLGGINSLDILHGAVYIGNNKMGVMPAYIQSHIALQELKMADLPFRKEGDVFTYSEGVEEKASITPNGDKLIIQRELPTLAGTPAILQYLPPSEMTSIPQVLTRRLNAEHFFLDAENVIHAFTADFKPILKINGTKGTILDHNGVQVPINLEAPGETSIVKKLATIFPQDEMVQVNANSVYLPALAKYVSYNDATKQYLLADKLSDVSGRRILEITKDGNALTRQELNEAEILEVEKLTSKIEKLKGDLSKITKSDLVSEQSRQNIKQQIKACENQIAAINKTEYFIFIPVSSEIKAAEDELVRLRTSMESAYDAYRKGIGDKDSLARTYDSSKKAYLQGKAALTGVYSNTNMLRIFDVKNGSIQARDFQSILHIGSLKPEKTQVFTQLLGANLPKTPLKPIELKELLAQKEALQNKASLTKDEKLNLIMLMGVELHHHIQERTASATGKLRSWNEKDFIKLKTAFTQQVQEFITPEAAGTIPLEHFSELWRAVQAEFNDERLTKAFTKTVVPVSTGEKKPVNIHAKTTNMPVESIGLRSLVHFVPNDDPGQIALEVDLRKLAHSSVQDQEEGYYYENYGLFTQNTLNKLFSIKGGKPGIEGISTTHVEKLMALMKEKEWIIPIPRKPGESESLPIQYKLAKHPSEFFSATKISGFFTEQGFKSNEIKAISERTETFLYQTAVNGGKYSIQGKDDKEKAHNRTEIIQKIKEAKSNCNIEYLLALDKVNSLLENASPKISMAQLNAAYLLNNYGKILASFASLSPEELAQKEIALNNALTRVLFYKTELAHLNDIDETFGKGQDNKALCMLHTKRNYSLDKLLDSELPELDETTTMEKVNQDRKMQRAFLLFESEFGHRCNARQVSIFRGLLLDDRSNPDKIDSAQARMGFGKTTLLPLIALFKTGGNKLVRYVVPKSALETNTSDASGSLTNMTGTRAIQDDFQRYRMVPDEPGQTGENSLLLQSLRDAKADLNKRLALYKRSLENHEVLMAAPNVRNAMQCQLQILLDMLPRVIEDPLQKVELMACISVLNEIRSMETITVFDELDATQDSASTDVNYTTGEKQDFAEDEIYPLEVITQAILEEAPENRTVEKLSAKLLEKFKITDDPNKTIANYISALKGVTEPSSDEFKKNKAAIYLMRAILTDPAMLSIFTSKSAGSDFGVYFENTGDGAKTYDYGALKSTKNKREIPLLICVPYSAANTPKPKGSRFDNPEVTAITTLLYYKDPKMDVQEIPHLEFLVDSFVNGMTQKTFADGSGNLPEKYKDLYSEISKIAAIADPLIRAEKRTLLFAEISKSPEKQTLFREMLARAIIHDQIKTDPKKANSNRYEQGTIHDEVLGFSGTAGDTSSHFQENMLDPAADGNMTLGIMGREDCQKTFDLDTLSIANKGKEYTSALLNQLVSKFIANPNTRTLIDVGGLCKLPNRAVALELAIKLQEKGSRLQGVIFYDDVTNMKKLLTYDPTTKKETVVDLTADMVKKSDEDGLYFTYYDQSHSRGADIKQMDKAHAVLTMYFTVTNNDYKQAIMRMRKIVDKAAGQSFSIAVPDVVKKEIISDLKLTLAQGETLSGNHIALWLRKKELQNNLSNVGILKSELDSVIKNAVLQLQAQLTKDLETNLEALEKSLAKLKPGEKAEIIKAKKIDYINEFTRCMEELNKKAAFITGASTDLKEKYGKIFGKVSKDEFLKQMKKEFEENLAGIFTEVNNTRSTLGLAEPASEEARIYYKGMSERIIEKRGAFLPLEFDMPSSSNNLSEGQVENQNESQSQSESESESQSMSQTHTFSAVSNEDVLFKAKLVKQTLVREEVSLSYLSTADRLISAHELSGMSTIFKKGDNISVSPIYTKDPSTIPPVRYLLARNDGKQPSVILINQDEANEFKKTPKVPWTLYDLRKADPIPLAKPILDKLNLASLRYKIEGDKTDELANSLTSVCTPEQLRPSLHVNFTEARNVSKEALPFKIEQWGFKGKNASSIYIDISQVRKAHGSGHIERGVEISFGKRAPGPRPEDKATKIQQGSIVISEKISERLSKHPSLRAAAKAVHAEFATAKRERAAVRTLLHEYQVEKAAIIQRYDSKKPKIDESKPRNKKNPSFLLNEDGSTKLEGAIENAELLKANLIKKREQLVMEAYRSSMATHTDRRQQMQNMLKMNLVAVGKTGFANEQGFGVPIDHPDFTDPKGANQYKIGSNTENNMFLKTLAILHEADKRGELADETALQKKLDELVGILVTAVGDRYNHCTSYRAQDTNIMEALHKGANVQGKETTLWGDNLQRALGFQMKNFFDGLRSSKFGAAPEQEYKLVNGLHDTFAATLEEAKGENLSLKSFHNLMKTSLTEFATKNEKDIKIALGDTRAVNFNVESYVTNMLTTLGMSYPNTTTIETMMKQIITEELLVKSSSTTAETKDLYDRLKPLLAKTKLPPFIMPDLFANPPAKPVTQDELRAALVKNLQDNNLRATPQMVGLLMERYAPKLEGQQWLIRNLHEKPVVEFRDYRKSVKVDGSDEERFEEVSVFGDVKKVLTTLDQEIFQAQQAVDKAKEDKARELRNLENAYNKPSELLSTCKKSRSKLVQENAERLVEMVGAQSKTKDETTITDGNLYRATVEANRTYNVLHTEWIAFKKLLGKLLNLVPFFSNNDIVVKKTDIDPPHPILDYMQNNVPDGTISKYDEDQLAGLDFFDSHFHIPSLITPGASVSAELSFSPPEFYQTEKELRTLESRMHHHDEEDTVEEDASTSLEKAVQIVRTEASALMPRTHTPEFHSALEIVVKPQEVDEAIFDLSKVFGIDDLPSPSDSELSSILGDEPLNPSSIATTVDNSEVSSVISGTPGPSSLSDDDVDIQDHHLGHDSEPNRPVDPLVTRNYRDKMSEHREKPRDEENIVRISH